MEPRPVVFDGDWNEVDFDGVPLVESVLQAFVGRCQECGRAAEAQRDGSVLANLVVLDGTLYGDTFCASCVTEGVEGPLIHLPPPPREFHEHEEGD
jgi:hypothetical protein